MKLRYERREVIRGLLIYAIGDTIAALMLGQFLLKRMLAMMAIGGILYAFEIPNFFRWIDHFVKTDHKIKNPLYRTLLAFFYFNPLWIARHLLLINLFTGAWGNISWALLSIGVKSFIVKIPISLLGNYIIQVKIPMKWRFFGSAVLSSLFALYYAVSAVIFA